MAVNCRQSAGPCNTAWENQTDKYLGLRFTLADGVHWGWAELTTRTLTSAITVHLEGLAYDTAPGQRITAGQTTDEEGWEPTGGAASLGVLALGAPGLAYWGPANTVPHGQLSAPGQDRQ